MTPWKLNEEQLEKILKEICDDKGWDSILSAPRSSMGGGVSGGPFGGGFPWSTARDDSGAGSDSRRDRGGDADATTHASPSYQQFYHTPLAELAEHKRPLIALMRASKALEKLLDAIAILTELRDHLRETPMEHDPMFDSAANRVYSLTISALETQARQLSTVVMGWDAKEMRRRLDQAQNMVHKLEPLMALADRIQEEDS